MQRDGRILLPLLTWRKKMRSRQLLASLLLLLFSPLPLLQAAPLVQFELAAAPGFPVTGQRKWIDFMKKCGITSIRIRGAKASDEPEVDNIGTAARPIYEVTGLISADNRLYLVGGTFRHGDKTGLSGWINKLKLDGIEALTARTGVFGLTDKQLVMVHEQLVRPVEFSTRGQKNSNVLQRIARQLDLQVTVEASARVAMAGNEVVVEEMQKLTSGTVMAAVLRPLGLVLVPDRPQGQPVRLLVTSTATTAESWPVGWPPQKTPGNLAPDLFKFLNVEIRDIVLQEALDALKPRIGLPMLMDHNSMVRNRIDPKTVKVTVPAGRTFYKKILDRLLSQVGLTCQLRVDEAEKPFLWVTSAKKK